MPNASIKIPAELFAIAESSHFDGETAWPVLSTGYDDVSFEGPVAWEVDVTNTDGALLVEGSARARAHTQCARCLEDVAFDVDGQIEGWFLISPDAVGPDDVGEDELQVLPADHIIDLDPLIGAALLMEVPNLPLCSPDCAGLCPHCGASLNEGPCDCVEEAAEMVGMNPDNPFSVLANFDFGE